MKNHENCVIGTMLADPAAMELAEHLRPSDFTGVNQYVWGEMLSLHRRKALGPRAVTEALRSAELLDQIGTDGGEIRGEDYLSFLMTFAESATVAEFIRQVEDYSIKRSLEGVAGLILREAKSPREADEILDNAEKQIFALRRGHLESGMRMGDILKVFMPRLTGFRDGTIHPAWTPDIQAIKDIVDYIDDSDYIVNASRPGEGKSSLLRWEAIQGAVRGKRVLTFNMENDELEYAKFAIAALTDLDSAKLRNPRLLSEAELERVSESADLLKNLPWTIVTLARPTAADIDRIARKMYATNPFDLMQVDYIQLISNGNDNRVEDVSITSSTLRGIALRLRQPVMAASQFSRNIEYRGDNADPKLADLRESGSIEQDATQVWAQRSLWPNPPTPEQIQASRFPENFDQQGRILPVVKAIPIRMFILKNRNGPVGVTDPIKWNKATGEFATLTREDGRALLRARENVHPNR